MVDEEIEKMSGMEQMSPEAQQPESKSEKDKLMMIQPNIAQINQRTVTSTCHSNLNRNALDWGRNGLLAYASHGVIVVVDPSTMNVIQTLDKDHKTSVVRLKWSRAWSKKHVAHEMMLASADASGRILIWNVKSGEVKTQLAEGSRPVSDMEWLGEAVDDTGHLLLALHPPNNLVLWDTYTGQQMWKKSYANETLVSFDFDPFDVSRLAFKTTDCILFINDFHPSKCPVSGGQKLYVSGPLSSSSIRQSPNRTSTDSSSSLADDSRLSRTKLKKFMKDFVLGQEVSSHEQAIAAIQDCQQVMFHRNVRNHLLLVYAREVLVLDLDIGQTVGIVVLDRSCSPIIDLVACQKRDGFFMLLENGSVALRLRKNLFNVASTPMIASALSRSISSCSVNNANDTASDIFNPVTEISYEQKSVSEAVRLSKHAKVLKFALDPVTETGVLILASDGKLINVNVRVHKKKKSSKPSVTLDDLIPPTVENCKDLSVKLLMSAVMSNLGNPPYVLRMCPPLTTKNWPEYNPYLASGGNNGNIQIIDMSTGKVEREFATHTYPVRGMEWSSLHSILSHAHQNLTGGGSVVRNELNHTDIRTGQSIGLRSGRSEEPPIDMIRISHLKQYFIVSFRGAPFELWDLKNLSLLRTMPKKFPPITALEWSPLHNLKSLKKKQEERESSSESSVNANESSLVAKEHFVFTDPEGQLYHFSVEGNAIKDGTKIPAEASLCKLKS